jgi:hypothetical protein
MGRLLFFLLNLTAGMAVHAQADTTQLPYPIGRLGFHRDEITVQAAYHQGRYGFAELAIGRNVYGAMHHAYGLSYYIGTEARVDRPQLWGVKAGAYVTGGFALGVQFIHYMEGGSTMQVLRPEYGIGLFKARFVYAYNLRLTKPHLDGVSTHMFTLSYAFRLKRLPRDDQRKASH